MKRLERKERMGGRQADRPYISPEILTHCLGMDTCQVQACMAQVVLEGHLARVT